MPRNRKWADLLARFHNTRNLTDQLSAEIPGDLIWEQNNPIRHALMLLPGLGLLAADPEPRDLSMTEPGEENDGSNDGNCGNSDGVEVEADNDDVDSENGSVDEMEVDGDDWQTPTCFIVSNGKSQHIFQYLGLDWESQISDAHALSLSASMTPLKALKSTLRTWQARGVKLLETIALSSMRGAFLCDAMGLGKSLTALVTALKLREALPSPGPILVVTKKACVEQWFGEIVRHFHQDQRPSCIILDSKTPVSQVLGYDVAICSYSYVVTRHLDHEGAKDFFQTANAQSIDVARKECTKKSTSKKLFATLHSEAYKILAREFTVLILDESHEIKNIASLRHQAICALNYRYALCLSGTPLANKWDDIYGQLCALPGNVFKSKEHFDALFGPRKSAEAPSHRTKSTKPPPNPSNLQLRVLKRFLLGFTVGRPKEILNLQPYITKIITFNVEESTAKDITKAIKDFRKGMGISSSKSRKNFSKASKKDCRAMAHLTYAQLLGMNENLASRSKKASSLEGVVRRRQPAQESIEVEDGTNSDYMGITDDPQGAAVDGDDPTDRTYDPRVGLRCYNDDGGEVFPQFEDDVGSDAEYEDDLDSDEEYGDDDDELTPEQKETLRRQHREERKTWKHDLSNWTDEQVRSPRVNTVIDSIRTIRQSNPYDKAAVFSVSRRFLDIIAEDIQRRAPLEPEVFDFEPARYDGLLNAEAKVSSIAQFSVALPNKKPVLLISATAGGTGLNITAASHVILCEPFWNDNIRNQVISRAHRLGQDQVVTVYDIIAENSDIDQMMAEKTEFKRTVNDDIMASLQRPGNTCPLIPDLPDGDDFDAVMRGESNEGDDTAMSESDEDDHHRPDIESKGLEIRLDWGF